MTNGSWPSPPPELISSEDLAYWYLRLNGFLTIPNFVVHPDTGSEQRTDVDVLGVRFPHRAELVLNPMADDEPFASIRHRPYVVIAEVKRGPCALNGPWTDPDRENIERLLSAIGALREDEIDPAAGSLYETGGFSNDAYSISLFCFGSEVNPALQRRYPAVPQKVWNDALSFVFQRFTTYRAQKACHPQWDQTGTLLYRLVDRALTVEQFISSVEVR